MNLNEVASRLEGVKKSGDGFMARCPAHDDGAASLSLAEGDGGKVLVKCFAGCATEDVLKARGLKMADLFPDSDKRNGNGHARGNGKIVATYDYQNEAGKLLFQVVRYEPKDFRQRRPDLTAPGGWDWSTKGTCKVLFRLPEVAEAAAQGWRVVLAEGEKDVLALVKHGFTATCNPGGAGKWLDYYTTTLRGANVTIIADKDKPGRDHAALVAAKLQAVTASVKIIECPDVGGRAVKDAADYFAAGGTDNVLTLLMNAAPEWQPAPPLAQLPTTTPTGSPASDAGDIRGTIIGLLTDKELCLPEKRRLIGEAVVQALAQRGRFFFHDDLRDFDSAMFFDGDRKRLERIRSDGFIAWLSSWLAVNRADTVFNFVRSSVETAALSGPHTTGILPESFWAAREGAFYLSAGDGAAVKITASGVNLVDNGTDGVLFPVGKTLAPWKLTDPHDPFVTCSLFRDTHCDAEHGPDLLRLWLYSLPTNPRSKPPLCLAGEVGSGKTRLAKGIAELYGLPFIAAKVEEESEGHFWPSIDQGGLFTLDNADTRCRWLADALANAATDGCSQRRRLYTNSETVVLRARAWIAVTTANPTFASDAGLADRLLLLRLCRRAGATSDTKLTDEILAARDGALSHVADTLRKALADTSPTPGGLNQRHPDFAAFAVKIGRALGREAECVAALQQAEVDKSAFCLENDPIAAALLAHLRAAGAFTGTAAELVPKLCEVDPTLNEARPLSPRRLGKRLAALWSHLEKALESATKQTDRNGIMVFAFKSAGFAGFERPDSLKPLHEE
jgi:hypothetical protein